MADFDIHDIIIQDEYETVEEFMARQNITLKIATIEEYELNPVSAVVIGRMIMNKIKLGVTYDAHVEQLIEKLLTLINMS